MSLDGFIACPDDSMDWAFGGVRLYGGDDDGSVELERISLGEAGQLPDLSFRVKRS